MDDAGKVTNKDGVAEEVAYEEAPIRNRVLKHQESDPERAQMLREEAEEVGDETLERIAKEKAESPQEQLQAAFSNLEKNMIDPKDKEDMAHIAQALKEIEANVVEKAERWAQRGLTVTPQVMYDEGYFSDVPVANLNGGRSIEYRLDSTHARDGKGDPIFQLTHLLPKEGQLELLRELGVLGNDEGLIALGEKGTLSHNKKTRYLSTKMAGVKLVWTDNYGAELHLGPDYFTKMLEKLK